MKALFDTNILIDYINGEYKARDEIGRYTHHLISTITWIEVMVGVREQQEEEKIRHFLNRFSLVALSNAIAEEAVRLRRLYRVRVPDAIIWASARNQECLLVTRNERDFPEDDVSIRFPYKL